MAKSYVIVGFYLAVTVCQGISIRENDEPLRIRREIPDECRPFMPPHGHHHRSHHGPDDSSRKMPPKCCELPEISPVDHQAFEKCRDSVAAAGAPPRARQAHKRSVRPAAAAAAAAREENPGDSNKEVGGTPLPLPPPGDFLERKHCYFNCVFNESGLLTKDGLLNEDLLNQKLLQTATNNTKWTTTIDPLYKKCIAAAKEADSQSQKSCKQGAAEYLKCMSRELFFNCPSDIWVNSAECNEFKNKLEKCPNLWAPHPHPPLRLHHNQRHHHRLHEHHLVDNQRK